MIKFSPSLLASDFMQLGNEARRMEQAGAQWLHVDVMDGHFVPNLTIGPDIVKGFKRCTSLELDVHLMITDPARYADAFIDAGASGVTFHMEAMADVEAARALAGHIRARGAWAGVSIKPGTPPQALEGVLDAVNMVLVMTVEPGFGGQKLIQSCVEKLPEVRRLLAAAGNPDAHVQVDGGVTQDNALGIVQAGADVLVMGTGLFRAENPAEIMKKLCEQVSACGR